MADPRAFVKAADVPVFGVYVDCADSNSNLPNGLQRYLTIPWEMIIMEESIIAVLRAYVRG